ncbi:MAG: hypothetical protein JW939_00780, partial [Candidatus Thermoplasmatota archaeon]|nr:hypothetical protein [Candidatus Thermoplasmatota archaeon]
MNRRYLFIVTLFFVLVSFIEPVKGDAVLCLDHFNPLEPVKGDTVEFYVVALTGNGSDILSVELTIDDQTRSMVSLREDIHMKDQTAAIYFCTLEVQSSGTFNVTYT